MNSSILRYLLSAAAAASAAATAIAYELVMVTHLDSACHSSTRSGPKPLKHGDALRMVMLVRFFRRQLSALYSHTGGSSSGALRSRAAVR